MRCAATCLLALSLLCLGASDAWATQQVQASEAAASSKQTSKKQKTQRPPATARLAAPGGSGETPAERSARLKRECKGRPNAGACTGHTD